METDTTIAGIVGPKPGRPPKNKVDLISGARLKLKSAIEQCAAADAALAQIRAAEKQGSQSRWAAQADVARLSKVDDDADTGALDALIADLAAGKKIDVSQPLRDRAAALDKARADLERWEKLGANLRARAAAAQEEIHWATLARERARDGVLAAIGADLMPALVQERAGLLKRLEVIGGKISAFRRRVDGDARAMLEVSDREAIVANNASYKIAPQWIEFAEQLLTDPSAEPPRHQR